jgi:two-component system chemotaxis response regulator CheY
MKMLIVEDDVQVMKLMKQWLAGYGECDTAGNGLEAIEFFREALESDKMYDLIFLDFLMPEMSGQKVLKEIRETEKEKGIGASERVKIIIITAMSDPNNIIGAFKLKCEAYLVKPVRKGDLDRELNRLGFYEGGAPEGLPDSE